MSKTICGPVFRKSYDKSHVTYHNTGSRVVDEVRLIHDTNGNCVYKKVGDYDLQEYISSFKDGCSLDAMLNRIQLLPVHEKISYLNQTPGGVSGDLTFMPTDGTEAFILMERFKDVVPDYAKRIANGESFESILNSLFNKNVVAPVGSAAAESEVNDG